MVPFVDLTLDEGTARDPVDLAHGSSSAATDWIATALVPGAVVEVLAGGRSLGAEFIEIEMVERSADGRHQLITGLPLTRARNLPGGWLPTDGSINEVVAVHDIVVEAGMRPQGNMSGEGRHLTVELADIVRVRELRYTNGTFPINALAASKTHRKNKALESSGPLVCRWRYFRYWWPASNGNGTVLDKCPFGEELRHCEEADCDNPKYRVSDEAKRMSWRGGLDRVGSNGAAGRYVFRDFFCGAGGASQGAREAGLEVASAVDSWDVACETFQLNFPDAEVLQMNVWDYLLDEKYSHPNVRTDIMNLSPPCQPYSPAHTTAGPGDEENIRALTSCAPLVEKQRPRLFTLEQTFGLCSFADHRHRFNELIRSFVSLGCSLYWERRTVLLDYGLPQNRKRLLMIGASPGQSLPRMPQPTHSDHAAGDTRGRPYITVRRVLDKLTQRRAHLPEIYRFHISEVPISDLELRHPNPRYALDKPLGATITCNGAQIKHPLIDRQLTVGELSAFQGFPVDYIYCGSIVQMRRQVGNAFSPMVVGRILRHLRRHLEQEDGVGAVADHLDGTDDSDDEICRNAYGTAEPGSRERPILIHASSGGRRPISKALQRGSRSTRHLPPSLLNGSIRPQGSVPRRPPSTLLENLVRSKRASVPRSQPKPAAMEEMVDLNEDSTDGVDSDPTRATTPIPPGDLAVFSPITVDDGAVLVASVPDSPVTMARDETSNDIDNVGSAARSDRVAPTYKTDNEDSRDNRGDISRGRRLIVPSMYEIDDSDIDLDILELSVRGVQKEAEDVEMIDARHNTMSLRADGDEAEHRNIDVVHTRQPRHCTSL